MGDSPIKERGESFRCMRALNLIDPAHQFRYNTFMMRTFGPGTFAGFYRTDHDPPSAARCRAG